MDHNIRLARREMRTTQRDQEMLYNKHMNQEINQDSKTIDKDYKSYIEGLNGFYASAFDKVLLAIAADDEKVKNQFAKAFNHIPDYVAKRSVWDRDKREVLHGDSPTHIKQQALDTLNRSRSRSHNGVIDLFNTLSQYAEDNNLANPYPMSYYLFDKNNRNHRADVADILTRHTTLIERLNEVKQNK